MGAIFSQSHMVVSAFHTTCAAVGLGLQLWSCLTDEFGSILAAFQPLVPISVLLPAQVSLGRWDKPRLWMGSASWTW